MEVHPRDFRKDNRKFLLVPRRNSRHDALFPPAHIGIGIAAPASHDERAASSHERAATTLASDFDALHDG